MTRINKEEVFSNLKDFLKSKGIELQEGAYAERIRQGCSILTDSVNLSQRALGRTKVAVEKGLDRVRQVIHERTAPKAAANKPAAEEPEQRRKTAPGKRPVNRPSAAKAKAAPPAAEAE